MRFTYLLVASLLASVASVTPVEGQDSKGTAKHPPTDRIPTSSDRSFSIEVIEFQIDAISGADLSVEELVASFDQMKREGALKRVEKIRLSVLEHRQSSVNFSKLVAIVTGSHATAPGRPPVRSMRDIEIGTMTEAIVVAREEKRVSVDLAYRSSRLDGEGTDDSPPVVVTVNIETSQVLELGKPMLLAGISADPNVYVLIKVTE